MLFIKSIERLMINTWFTPIKMSGLVVFRCSHSEWGPVLGLPRLCVFLYVFFYAGVWGNFRGLRKSTYTSEKEHTLNKLQGEPRVSYSWIHLFLKILLRFGRCKNVWFRHQKKPSICGTGFQAIAVSVLNGYIFLLIRRNTFLGRRIMYNIQAWGVYWRLGKSYYFDHRVLGFNLENPYTVPAPGNCSAV